MYIFSIYNSVPGLYSCCSIYINVSDKLQSIGYNLWVAMAEFNLSEFPLRIENFLPMQNRLKYSINVHYGTA